MRCRTRLQLRDCRNRETQLVTFPDVPLHSLDVSIHTLAFSSQRPSRDPGAGLKRMMLFEGNLGTVGLSGSQRQGQPAAGQRNACCELRDRGPRPSQVCRNKTGWGRLRETLLRTAASTKNRQRALGQAVCLALLYLFKTSNAFTERCCSAH